MSLQPVVETIDLAKAYNGKMVVDKLNLQISAGEIFGFLGPNGAGKTTTILMLLGLTEPTSGVARIAGYNSTREPLKVKSLSGYIPEKVGFYEDLTAGYNLAYTARLNGISEKIIKERVTQALEIVGLPNAHDRKVLEFSRGMKQRLAIADILVKLPKVAFLDEPTLGIDPEGINQVLDLIARIAKEQNMTIVMSSHQLQQVQQICSRVGIIVNGKMLVEGKIDQLSKDAFGGKFTVEVQIAKATSGIIDSIKKLKGVETVEKSDDLLLVSCSKDLRPQIAKAVIDADGSLIQMKIQSHALEDIYLKYFHDVES